MLLLIERLAMNPRYYVDADAFVSVVREHATFVHHPVTEPPFKVETLACLVVIERDDMYGFASVLK